MAEQAEKQGVLAKIGLVAPNTPLGEMLSKTRGEYLCSWKTDTAEDKMAVYQALNGESKPIKEVLNMELSVVAWLIKPSDEQVRDDGSVDRFPITVLVLDDGTTVRAGSRGVAECIIQLAELYGECPWNPPVKLTPKSRGAGEGKQWVYLAVPSVQRKKRS